MLPVKMRMMMNGDANSAEFFFARPAMMIEWRSVDFCRCVSNVCSGSSPYNAEWARVIGEGLCLESGSLIEVGFFCLQSSVICSISEPLVDQFSQNFNGLRILGQTTSAPQIDTSGAEL